MLEANDDEPAVEEEVPVQHENGAQDTEDSSHDPNPLQLSELSSHGIDGAQTLKLFVQVGDCSLRVMIIAGQAIVSHQAL